MKIKSKKIFAMAILIGSGLLSGCKGSDVSIVKEARMKGWPDYTIGQMLDKRKACTTTDWKSFKDDRGRVIVEYTCVHEPGTKYIQELNIKLIKEAKESPPKMASYQLESAKRGIDLYRQQLQDQVDRDASPSQIAHTERILKSSEEEYLRIKQEDEGYFQRAQAEHLKKIELLERRAANFQETNEVYQWAIQENSPVFLASKINVKFSDANQGLRVDMKTMLDIATNDSIEMTAGYKKAISDLNSEYGK